MGLLPVLACGAPYIYVAIRHLRYTNQNLQSVLLSSYFLELLMKQLLKTMLIVSAFFFAISYDASASSYPARLGAKLGNGIANATTGIVEIPKTIMVTNRAQGPAYAATAGLITGIVHMMGRTLSGAYDLVTFMIPTKPIVTPDYVWENFDKETSYRSTWQLR